MSSLFSPTPFGPGLTPTDISQVANDNFYRLQTTLNEMSGNDGWIANALPAVSTVAYNGNRSYTITFSEDVSSVLSPGMRLKTTRTVKAPTQCTSLNGSTQYWSKTSPAGLTFTTTFTCSAWVKLNSYQAGGIIARRNADTEGWSFQVNADGTLRLAALRIASNNKRIDSYQSIPLNKWVHVAATMDVSAGDTTAQKIWIDGVEVPRTYTLTGTATALVQGTTALVVGAAFSAGTTLFNGKIAQAAVFSAQLSDATIKSYYSQGLAGTETNLVSAYSFNATANDLNTTNANNLTAQGSAVATNDDSPFSTNSLGVETGTDDYSIVQAVSTTTATVQVPAGCTIPTSGGISYTYISTSNSPSNFPLNKFLWELIFINKSQVNTGSIASTNTITNFPNHRLTVPIGAGELSFNCFGLITVAVAVTFLGQIIGLSTANNSYNDLEFVARGSAVSSSTNEQDSFFNQKKFVSQSVATIYYLNSRSTAAANTTQYADGSYQPTMIKYLPLGV